jgi:phospho-N-acetylmuramoyl-pentapeptide-transferase
MGFFWYNRYPARMIMGDSGALALGAILGLCAIMSKRELLLPVTGGLFVVETVSVIAQVISYRLRKKRLFKMAPLHHHFELSGISEPQITLCCTGITALLCVIVLWIAKFYGDFF